MRKLQISIFSRFNRESAKERKRGKKAFGDPERRDKDNAPNIFSRGNLGWICGIVEAA
jgi:hypothetical protein